MNLDLVRVFIWVTIAGIVSLPILGQETTIRIETKLVTVPVSVVDRNGRYIAGLRKEDFRIFEDGVEQTLEHFEPIEAGFTVLLLLDRSGSMSGEHRIKLIDAANAFVRQLRPHDQIIVATFADTMVTVADLTKVADLSKGFKIESLSSDTTTLVYDSVDSALRKLRKIRGRKALILFSDGVGDGRFSSAKENLEDAEEMDVPIYTVQFDTSSNLPDQYRTKRFFEGLANARRYMLGLASVSGGRHFQFAQLDDLARVFRSIAEELSMQYTLGYYPEKEGKKGERRQIKVTVNRPDLAVRSRTSYIMDK